MFESYFYIIFLLLLVKHFSFDTRFYIVLFYELSEENKITEKISKRMTFQFKRMCHL